MSATVAVVSELPACCLCSDGTLAQYDAKLCDLYGGQWGYVCQAHFVMYGQGLGLGKGQRLVVAGESDKGMVRTSVIRT